MRDRFPWSVFLTLTGAVCLAIAWPSVRSSSPILPVEKSTSLEGEGISAIGQPAIATQPTTQLVAQQPQGSSQVRRHRIAFTVSDPSEIQVEEGEAVSKGQILAAQTRKQEELEARRSLLQESLQGIQATTVETPLEPEPLPRIQPLPPPSYEREQAAIEAAKARVKLTERKLQRARDRAARLPYTEASNVDEFQIGVEKLEREREVQLRKLDAVRGMENLPSAVVLHEEAVLAELEKELEIAQSRLEQASGRLATAREDQNAALIDAEVELENARSRLALAEGELEHAKYQRSQDEYQYSVTLSRRIEEQAESQRRYQEGRQRAQEEERDKRYKISQITVQLGVVDDALSNLGEVRSPYTGTIRKIKVEGQQGNEIQVEITLDPGGAAASTPASNPSANPFSGISAP